MHTLQVVEQKGEDDEYGDEDSDDSPDAEEESDNMIADEPQQEWPDLFVLSCSKDCNILLHRLSNGVKIGKFGQDAFWNIFDMSQYDTKTVKPNYVRDWIKEKKVSWRRMIEDAIEIAKQESLIDPDEKIDVKTIIKENRLAQIGLNASMDSAGKLSWGDDDEEQDTGGRPAKDFEEFEELDGNALEDSDEENISNQFKGAMLRPDGGRAYNKKKGNEENKYPSVYPFDQDYLEAFKSKKDK